MRCFLGLDIDMQSKLEIQSWREQVQFNFEHAVPAANFHITLVFLGQVQPGHLDQLYRQIDEHEFQSFSLNLETLGYWPKPKVLWLCASHVPEQAYELVNKLTSFARNCHLCLRERKYIPHLTLVRKCSVNPAAPLLPPDFKCRFDKFCLFESVSGKHGIHYPIRQSWKFKADSHN